MNLQRHAPRLQNAGVSLLWEMAMQEGHRKQKFHASLALLICCRVNVLLGGAKTLTGRRRKTDKKRSIIPINPSDTKLHNYIRVLATICEGVYHSQFKASFPRYYRMVMKRDFQSDSEDDDDDDDDDDEEEFSSFADLLYDRLQRQDEETEGNMHLFIDGLPNSVAKRKFEHICGLTPYFPNFNNASINKSFGTYAVLPAFTIKWLQRSPLPSCSSTSTCTASHGGEIMRPK